MSDDTPTQPAAIDGQATMVETPPCPCPTFEDDDGRVRIAEFVPWCATHGHIASTDATPHPITPADDTRVRVARITIPIADDVVTKDTIDLVTDVNRHLNIVNGNLRAERHRLIGERNTYVRQWQTQLHRAEMAEREARELRAAIDTMVNTIEDVMTDGLHPCDVPDTCECSTARATRLVRDHRAAR